jgi:hypothetical protein
MLVLLSVQLDKYLQQISKKYFKRTREKYKLFLSKSTEGKGISTACYVMDTVSSIKCSTLATVFLFLNVRVNLY